RVAFGGMAERTGLRPDLVTYGKVIGGGFPVGAYGGRKELLDLVAPVGPVYQAGTLSANPVAMSAGLAMLKKLKREDPYGMLEKRVEELALRLEKTALANDLPAKVQRFSSLFWTVFGEIKTADGLVRAPSDTPAGQKETYAKIFHALLGEGIYLAPSGYEVSFLSTAHQPAQLDRFVAGFERSVRGLR
ncbi:MAG: aminotransferase class III-fold pyridoxal phosphate-dependent enzyme, partial [Bdellovibrionota bacterium]